MCSGGNNLSTEIKHTTKGSRNVIHKALDDIANIQVRVEAVESGDDDIYFRLREREGHDYTQKVRFGWKWGNMVGAARWNHVINSKLFMDISANYLGGLVMDTAGVPLSPFFAFLQEQSKEYPIVTNNGYVDAEGRLYDWKDENVFAEYRVLQYNYLHDDRSFKWAY